MILIRGIFYDLETTSTLKVGQLLNYSFISFDSDFNPVNKLNGLVKISRLELPQPEAILANRVDVIEHNLTAQDDEYQAVLTIEGFINDQINKYRPTKSSSKIPLIGFNSSRFDLPYLRTIFIRNGRKPYFNGKIRYADLLHGVKKIAMENTQFPRPILIEDGAKRLTLKLEAVCRELNLLEGAQSHESEEDVLLSLKLSAVLKNRFGLEIAEMVSYEPNKLDFGEVISTREPNRELGGDKPLKIIKPMMLLDDDGKATLWVDLHRYNEGAEKKSIYYINKSTGSLFVDDESVKMDDLVIAAKAKKEFSDVTLKNFFERIDCDVEADIHRLDFKDVEMMGQIVDGELSLESKTPADIVTLARRWKLRTFKDTDPDFEKRFSDLRKYALNRYSGKLRVEKSSVDYEPGGANPSFHPSLVELYSKVNQLITTREGRDLELLRSLKEFYDNSDIVRLAGKELLKEQYPPTHEK